MSNNKVAVVTGANKGLGFALVKELCEQFHGTVYLTSRDSTRGLKACKVLENLGQKPAYHQLDVTNNNSVKQFTEYIQKNHGKIDLLINNAGILFLKDCLEPKIYQAEQTMFVNFFSLVNFTEDILPLISNGGVIVNISSSSGHLSRITSEELRRKIKREDLSLDELKKLMNEYVDAVKEGREETDGWGNSPYVVSKVGVNAYTFMLHRRLVDRGISVNCVHPGYVQSDMTHGAGNITPAAAAKVPAGLALRPPGSGLFVWHNGSAVAWDGRDPREVIDGKIL
ncbi:carbonyl reductase [NADPH] 1-like [Cydia pomonella]|uniref:carbonyl reductase [NADPH] 1-like n=1 Tax=Cydia pomonella TaxID=82600 RepID=UPI002ADE19E6|nr:carbonyl reductase [NADPH] 1-like [Cydia pomonella]